MVINTKNKEVHPFILVLLYLLRSIASLCDDNLTLVIHVLYISGIDLHKYSDKHTIVTIY
jgi:hypothetical protein